MANAKFKITGNASVNRGYDANHSDVLQLQLEDQPAPDVYQCQYRIGRATSGAPAPTFSPSNGVASPANGVVECTMPASGVHLYEIVCTVNTGTDSSGKKNPDYTFSRLVAIRSTNGFRKIMAAETIEYNSSEGWASAFNELAEFIAVTPPLLTAVTGTAPIVVDDTDPQNPVVSISAATTIAPGSMSSADKLKLDGATSVSTPDKIVMYDGSGGICTMYVQACSGDNLVLYADGIQPVTLDGNGTGHVLIPAGILSSAYKFDAQANLTRSVPLNWSACKVGGSVSWSITDVADLNNDAADAFANLNIECYFPHGSHITSIDVRNKGAGGGGDPLPANPPSFSLYRKNVSTGVASLIATVNGTLDGTYRGNWRTTTIDTLGGGSGHIVDMSAYRYYIVITPEFGIDALAGCQVRGAIVNYFFPATYAIGLN